QPASQAGAAPEPMARPQIGGGLLERQSAPRGRQRVVLLTVAATLLVALGLVLLSGLGPREPQRPPVQTQGASPQGPPPPPAPPPRGGAGRAAPPPPPARAGAARPRDAPAEPAKQPAEAAKAEPPKPASDGLRAEDFERTVAESTPAYKKCIEEALRRNPK